MPKRDDKHSMAEDYLARIKWEGEHPYMADGSRPDVPAWKYEPVYSNKTSKLEIRFGTALLIALIVFAVLVIFQLVTTH